MSWYLEQKLVWPTTLSLFTEPNLAALHGHVMKNLGADMELAGYSHGVLSDPNTYFHNK